MLTFRVNKKYTRGGAVLIAEFVEQADAEFFIKAKLAADVTYKVNATYELYQGSVLIDQFLPTPGEHDVRGATTTAQGQGTQQRASFSPTPFNTAPRPPGMPHHWLDDKDKKD